MEFNFIIIRFKELSSSLCKYYEQEIIRLKGPIVFPGIAPTDSSKAGSSLVSITSARNQSLNSIASRASGRLRSLKCRPLIGNTSTLVTSSYWILMMRLSSSGLGGLQTTWKNCRRLRYCHLSFEVMKMKRYHRGHQPV